MNRHPDLPTRQAHASGTFRMKDSTAGRPPVAAFRKEGIV